MQTNDIEMEVLSEEEKREYRRQRRIRNQRKAYIALILSIVILVGAIVGGIFFINYKLKNSKKTVEDQQVQTEMENVAENSSEEIIGESVKEEEEQKEDSEEEVLDDVVESVISEMTLEEKVAGLFIVTPEAITGVDTAVQAGEGTKKALEQYPVGGLIYFAKNIKSEEQIKEMIEKSKSYCKYPLFIAVEKKAIKAEDNYPAENGVIKYFPWAGEKSTDTHNGLTVIDQSSEEWTEIEQVPFVTSMEGGADMIMVGHVSLPQIVGNNAPAIMSKEVISDVLRSQLEFNGVIITDAMNVEAVKEYYGADEAAIKALKAGADMVMMPEDFELAYKGVIEAVKDGTINEDRINNSLKRVFRIKYADSVGN